MPLVKGGVKLKVSVSRCYVKAKILFFLLISIESFILFHFVILFIKIFVDHVFIYQKNRFVQFQQAPFLLLSFHSSKKIIKKHIKNYFIPNYLNYNEFTCDTYDIDCCSEDNKWTWFQFL